MQTWQGTPPDAVHDRCFGRIRARYLVGVLFGYLAASAEVIAILRLLAGPRVHVVAAASIAVAGAIVGAGVMAATLSSALVWYRTGASPTPAQRVRASTLPSRHAQLIGAIWAAVGASVLALHHDAGPRLLFFIGACMLVAAAGASFMGYLLAERVLRPVFVVALADGASPRARRHGVWVRLLVTWGLCTAIPLGGIAAIVLQARFGWPLHTGAAISAPVLLLATVGTVAGLRGMTVAARSVADPLREVTEGMGRVGAGQYEVRTPVYDSSEIGVLQTGFNEMAAGIAERERVRDLFGRHVGRDVAAHALQQDSVFTGRVCDVGVVFIDLTGSTTLAANSPPEHVAEVLNVFFRIVVGVIDTHGGFVNKFEGDAALAIFGAPVSLDDPAGMALCAARSLRDALTVHRGMPDFGIGVTHGRVFAGNIGAEDRYEYTVIGDPVNEAARLSDLAKDRAGRILASAGTVSKSDPDEAAHWRTGDDVVLRGRGQPTTLAEPRAGSGAGTGLLRD
jgi:adenylate cyclase